MFIYRRRDFFLTHAEFNSCLLLCAPLDFKSVMRISDKLRLAGRQPFDATGCPG